MPYPIMAPSDTWYKGTILRSSIGAITFEDTPSQRDDIVESWNADINNDGSIKCQVWKYKNVEINSQTYETYMLEIAGNGSGKISFNENSMGAFTLTTATSVDDIFKLLENFYNTNLLDFSLVKNASLMFALLPCLSTIDVSTWNVDNITNMGAMFYTTGLTTITGLSNWNVSNVTNMQEMFRSCVYLTSLEDIANWKISKVINIAYMFQDCRSLTSLNLSNWDTSKVQYTVGTFNNCIKLTEIQFANWDLSSLTLADIMFRGCESLVNIDVSKWNVSNVITMNEMFRYCYNIKTLDVSKWDVGNVQFFTSMFSGSDYGTIPIAIDTLDVSKWNTSSAKDMSFMFYGCKGPKEIDVSNWNVSNCTNFDHFAAHANLKRKGIENWNTKSAVNMNAMFHNCAEEELDLSSWDVSNVKYFCQMFENSPNLKRIKGLDKWDTSSGVGFDEMFSRCYKLEEVDLSSFDTSKAKNGEAASGNGHKTATLMNMFTQCNSLRKITLGSKFSINGNGSNTNAANKLILPTPSPDYIEGADGNWYDCLDNTYAANNIPDKTANTYFAVLSEAFDSDTTPVIVNRGSLTRIAHAIRAKTGKTGRILFKDFANEIETYEGDIVLVSDTDMLTVVDGVLTAESYTCGNTICGQGITGGE